MRPRLRRRPILLTAALLAGLVGGSFLAWRGGDSRPTPTLATPAPKSLVGDPTPSFSGRAGVRGGQVLVRVYAGTRVAGRPVEKLRTFPRPDGSFSVSLRRALAPGVYTAQATQSVQQGRPRAASRATSFVHWRLGDANGRFSTGVSLGKKSAFRTAAAFDGVAGYLVVPDGKPLDAARGVTVEAWVRRRASGRWQVIVGKPGDGRSQNENYGIWIDPGERPVAFFGDGASYARVNADPLDERWHQLVATYDNRTARLYVDGVLRAATRSHIRLTPNALPLNVGRANDGTSFFGGLLDRVAVTARAVSDAQVRARYERVAASSGARPAVTLTTPEAGSSTADRTPAFAGMAGTTSLDDRVVRVRVDRVSRGSSIVVLTARRVARGAWGVSAPFRLAPGTYMARVEQRDRAGRIGRSDTVSFRIDAAHRSGGIVILAAGDIASCDSQGDEATATLLDSLPGLVLSLGDHAYDWGTPAEFARCYAPSWGRHRERTRPVIGGHEYGRRGGDASGYFRYFRRRLARFGAAATDPRRGWYSYDLGNWHVVALNTSWREVGLPTAGSAQVRWLRADLAAHRRRCTLALFHDPVFSSGLNGGSFSYKPLWDALYEAGADVVLNGHDHDYERFAPQRPNGLPDPRRGIREFVVGTGGASHYPLVGGSRVLPNSEVRNDDTFGVLRLVLRKGEYSWSFVPEPGSTFEDSGSGRCH